MKPFIRTVTKTFTPIWIKSGFSTYDDRWKAIRDTMRYKANSCFKCSHDFTDGESIALGCFKEIGNKVMCEPCAKELQSESVIPTTSQP